MTPERLAKLTAEIDATGRATLHRADLDAIRELCRLALIGMNQQWQPIETAPKDGRPIVVGRAGYFPHVWCWRQEIIGEDWPWLVALPCNDAMRLKPTHWMPLTQPEDTP